MDKVFVYNKGYCRGDEFLNKSSFPKELLVSILEHSQTLEEEGLEDYLLEQAQAHNLDEEALFTLALGGEFQDEDVSTFIESIKQDKPFFIEGEEGDYGVGPSCKEAILIYATHQEEDDWD